MLFRSSESLSQVIAEDAAYLKRSGLEYDQFADKLETLTQKAQRVLHLLKVAGGDCFKKIEEGFIVEKIYKISWVSYCGYQGYPWGCGEKDGKLIREGQSDTDYTIVNMQTKETIFFSQLHMHLIRRHQFFEGHTEYRLDPAVCARVLNILSGKSYKPEYVSQDYWISRGGWLSGKHKTIEDYLKDLDKEYHGSSFSIRNNGVLVDVGPQKRAWLHDKQLFIISLMDEKDKVNEGVAIAGIPMWGICQGAYEYEIHTMKWVNP